MTEKRLLVSLFVLFVASAAVLFAMNERGLDPHRGKAWWSLAFVAPAKTDDFSFVITNHTTTDRFRFSLSVENEILSEGELTVEPGTDFAHTPPLLFQPTSGRVTITVSHEGRDETIYRSL
jgi:hypothetical protein